MEPAHARTVRNVLIPIVALAGLTVLRVALGDTGLVVDVLAAMVAAWGAWTASRLARTSRSKHAWRFQVLFPLTWALAPLVWLVGGPALLADSLRAAALLTVAIAWWLTSRAVDSWSRVRLVVDGGLAAGSVFVAGWELVFERAWAHAGGGVDGLFVIAIPLGAAWAGMFLVGLLITEMQGRHRVMPALFLASLMAIGLSDIAWSLGRTPLWAVGWALAYLGTRAYQGTSERRQVVSTRLALTHAPYLLILPAATTFAVQWFRGHSRGPEVAAGVLMVLLLLVRQHVTLLENRRLVRRLAETECQLRHQATHDHLTGLAGRALLMQRLDTLSSSATGRSLPVSLIFIDLDRFKVVNDVHGHAAGDDLLVTLAHRLTAVIAPMGESALAVRISGDEFAVLMVGDHALDVEREAQAILAELSRPVDVNGTAFCVGASIGVASTTADVLEPSQLLGSADAAMYEVKRGAKGGVCLASALTSPPLAARAREHSADSGKFVQE